MPTDPPRVDGDPPAVEVVDLSVRRSGVEVLDGVSVEFFRGVTVVLGPNGAGKSTLFGALVGLLEPQAGRITIGAGTDGHRLRLGFVPQDVELPAAARLDDLVSYAAWLQQVPRGDREAAVDAALDTVRLTDRARGRVGRLSGGMRRRAQVAIAIVHEPELLVLDEPSVGLDPQEQAAFRTIFRQLGGRRSVILSTHVLDEAATIDSS